MAEATRTAPELAFLVDNAAHRALPRPYECLRCESMDVSVNCSIRQIDRFTPESFSLESMIIRVEKFRNGRLLYCNNCRHSFTVLDDERGARDAEGLEGRAR